MKKLFFAIGMMAMMSLASAAEAPAAGDDEPAYGCIATCKGVECKPEYADAEIAADAVEKYEARCEENMEQQQAPPEMK